MDFSFDPAKMAKVGAAEYDSTSDSDSDAEDDAYRMPATGEASLASEFGDFNPRKRRRTGRNAKESAALGIFGSESEDDSAGPGGRRWRQRKPLRKQGMSFVSSGQQRRDSDDEDEDEEEDNTKDDDDDDGDDDEYGERKPKKTEDTDEDEEEEDYDDDTGGVGLGFSSSAHAQGLGFAPMSFESGTHRQSTSPQPAANFDARNPLGRGFVPSSAYDPVLNARAQAQTAKKPPTVSRPSAFSGKAGGGGGGINKSSFGARMMAKMGYKQGEGLGAEGQGRNIIIEANLRPQGAGLGAVREKSEKERQEEKRQARLRGEVVVDSDEEEKKAKAAAAARRRKAMGISTGTSSGTSTPRRPKAKYMTIEEVKKAAPGLHIPEAFTPILDMTGPGRKLLTTSSGLMTPTSGAAATPGSGAGAAEETAEQAESRRLARRAQNDFMAILEEWQSLQNRKAFAELQAQQERQELAELEANLQAHTAMTDAFARLSLPADQDDNETHTWKQRWDETIALLKAAADSIPPASLDDMRDTLADISVAAIHPLFKQALAEWEPLKDPNLHIVEGLTSIQNLFGFGPDGALKKQSHEFEQELTYRRQRRKATASPYEAMIYKLWLPHVSAAVRRWDAVHDPDSVLALYEAWKPLLPDFVRAQLLEQDVVRKLDEAVAKWEPKRRRHQSDQSRNLPHLWLFPWLQHLPPRHLDPRSADGLVAEVKRKFRQLVDVWEFYRGVVPGLRQWKAVLRPAGAGAGAAGRDDKNDQWRALVMAHVLPSMARYVRAQFRVDPRDQAAYLEVVTGEFQWLDLLRPEYVGEVMVAEVFPMWHEALYKLLTTPGLAATLDEVAQWFQWWADEVFPESVRRLPSVTAELERGLVMVNEALDLSDVAATGYYDADRVRSGLATPSKGPALKTAESKSSRHGTSHHHRHHHHRHERQPEDKDTTAAADEPEEMSIRHYVEEWCETHDLQFVPERRRVHAQGHPLYRITARGDGKGGVLAYFQGLRLYAETKKGPLEIRVDREEDWAKLLAMAQ